MNWHNHKRDTRSPEERLDAALASIAPGEVITLRELSRAVFPDNKNDGQLALMIQDRVTAGRLERMARPSKSAEDFRRAADLNAKRPEGLEFGVRIAEPEMA